MSAMAFTMRFHISDYVMNRYQSNKNKYDQVAIGLSAFTNVLWRSDAEYNG